MVKFGRVIAEICVLIDIQTDRQTDTLAAMHRGSVEQCKADCLLECSQSASQHEHYEV